MTYDHWKTTNPEDQWLGSEVCSCCGGLGYIEDDCECGDDTCCCLEPIPPICLECNGAG
jgi:hypothetical protein